MHPHTTRRLAAAAMAGAATLAIAGFTALGSIFDYPGILKEPIADILTAFRDQQTAVTGWFLVLIVSAALLAPIGVLLGRIAGGRLGTWITGLGIAAAAVQVLGLARWVLLIPGVSDDATVPTQTADAHRTFELLHTWLGTVLGETIGYALTAAFTVLVVIAMTTIAPRSIGWLGYASAVLIATGVTIPLGLECRQHHQFRRLRRLVPVAHRDGRHPLALECGDDHDRPEPYALDVLRISVLGPLEVRRDGRRSQSRPVRRRSCWYASLSTPASSSPTGSSRICGPTTPSAPAATRCSPNRPSSAGARRSSARRRAGTPGIGSSSTRPVSTPSPCCADPADAAQLFRSGDDPPPPSSARRRSRCSAARSSRAPAIGRAPHRARLDAARLTLLETALAARLRLGRDGDVIGDVEAAVAAHPYQESLWGLLITALYRAGRQADALAAYRRVRTLLADELGLVPGQQLQQLEHQILMHDASLNVADPTRSCRDLAVGNLPSMSAELVGRDGEIAEVSDLLASERLVEVVGPGGIGKTAVAIATARMLRRPGGVWLVRLEMATTADDVVDA